MDVLKMLADLRREREQIEEAIIHLGTSVPGANEAAGPSAAWMANIKRRGRPPAARIK